MHPEPFHRRFLYPVLAHLAWVAAAYSLYLVASGFTGSLLRDFLAWTFGFLTFLGLGFGSFFVYLWALDQGAGPWERILVGLAAPFAWATKEVAVMAGVYTLGESLYFYLNPTNQFLLAALAAQMGLARMWARRRARWRGIFHVGPLWPSLVAVGLGVGAMILQFALDFGVQHFYVFQEGYKVFFGFGRGL
jgi:hypothetical protein